MKRPNILWFFTDEQRADSLGCYGSPYAQTPGADALAARGAKFEAAYTPSPVCVAARASLLTGHANSRLGVLNNHHALLPERARFLTHEWTRAGYNVATFGKQHYNCKTVRAFPTEAGRVLDEYCGYDDYRVPFDYHSGDVVRHPNPARRWLLAGRHPAAFEDTAEMQNVRDALAWLEAQPRDQPWFLRVSQNAPHTPTVAPAPFFDRFEPHDYGLPIDRDGAPGNLPAPVLQNLQRNAGIETLSDAQIERARASYFARCAFVDETLGMLLRAIEAQLENTFVIFCSDHGAHLGDHGFFQKQSFYEASARVPFLVAGPGIAQGVKSTPVSLGSLLPTLLELCGIAAPPCDFPSLASCLTGAADPDAAPIFSEIDFGIWNYRDGDRYVMVRDGDWKLAVFRDAKDKSRFAPDDGLMLHNLKDDPQERRNLAGMPEYFAHCEQMSQSMDARTVAIAGS